MISPETLVGKKLYKIGRAAAMCWIHFGGPVEVELRGRKLLQGEYALDLNCPWRIKNSNDCIELGSADMFTPSSENDLERNPGEEFNWDIQGNNLFDERAKRLFPKGTQIVVTSAALSGDYDLVIKFSNGLMLETFANVSSHEECWRLFKPGMHSEDLVTTGTGMEVYQSTILL